MNPPPSRPGRFARSFRESYLRSLRDYRFFYDDLRGLLARFERVTVLCSSNGFYDFAAAAGGLCATVRPGRLHLLWGACAPDHFQPTPWERVFYPLNGFMHGGHRWFAYPNHNLLRAFNPETSTSFRWRDGVNRRHFVKQDLESRFRCAGLDWCYVSPSQLGAAVRHVVGRIRGPLPLPADVLIAAQDGYWQGRPAAEVERIVRSYLPDARLDFQPVSHLWVVTPTYVTALFERHKTRLAQPGDTLPRSAPAPGPSFLACFGAPA